MPEQTPPLMNAELTAGDPITIVKRDQLKLDLHALLAKHGLKHGALIVERDQQCAVSVIGLTPSDFLYLLQTLVAAHSDPNARYSEQDVSRN